MMELVSMSNIEEIDSVMAKAIEQEYKRQNSTIQLVASENFTSKAVLSAQGSILTNKYAEGLPGRRYYGGCEDVDIIESLTIERVKQLYGADYANVQPHSGSSANLAVFTALLSAGDTILGMDLNAGGHLTHGHPVNFSGKTYNAVGYGVNDEGCIDYDEVEKLAKLHKPKLIIAGFSAYSQVIDWERFAKIAKAVDAYFMADMAHVSGLIAAGLYPSPIPHADVVTSTTHKTLRGPRGGMILAKASHLTKWFDKAVFPGTQGGPLMHVIAAKGVCYLEAMHPSFKTYQEQVIKNTQAMAEVLTSAGFEIISGKPQCHMFLMSVASLGISGSDAQEYLEKRGIIVNKNSIPNDPLPPMKTSGIRIGSQAMTTRGMDESGARKVAGWIADTLKAPADNQAQMVKAIQQFLESLNEVPNGWE